MTGAPITIPAPAHELIYTVRHGLITYAQWLKYEQARFARCGRKTQIVTELRADGVTASGRLTLCAA